MQDIIIQDAEQDQSNVHQCKPYDLPFETKKRALLLCFCFNLLFSHVFTLSSYPPWGDIHDYSISRKIE